MRRLARLLVVVVAATLPLGAHAAGTTLVQFGSPMKYKPNSANPGGSVDATWFTESFNDSTWASGTYGVGYEDDPGGAQYLIQTVVPNDAYCVYTRATFNIADPSAVTNLYLGADYDDGWTAWVNGVEVARSGEMPSGPLFWYTQAYPNHKSSGGYVPN